MQPHNEMADTLYQELTVDDCRSSTLHASGPMRPNQSGHRLLQHYYPQFAQHPHVYQLCHEYEHAHPLYQHPHQFQASQQEQTHYMGSNNGNRYCEGPPYYLGVPHCRQPQEGSTARVSFWKAFNTALSDAKGKQQQVNENERFLVSTKNFGELEAVYILARKQETTQTGSDSAAAVENSHTVASVGLPLSECHQSNVSAPATTWVDEKQALKRRARKKMRKAKVVKEEMGLMSAFFKRLVKRVINHQEALQNKFLEVIERMDKEQAEREEAWRREETEIYEREAIATAHDRDLASRREFSIVSSIQKITGQLSTTHEN